MTQEGLFSAVHTGQPLADRLRPRTLDDVVGQEHLLGAGKPLREAIEQGRVPSLVLWGPPGSGKTTLALIVAHHTDQHFAPFSAVTEGVPRVREIIRESEERRELEGRGTILFCDEIHRFNRAQQDAFLPSVERGVITLIGATTQNPSFELNGALLSRCQVHVLEPLSLNALRTVEARAAEAEGLSLDDDARGALVTWADGDARRLINAVEALGRHRLAGRPEPRHHASCTLDDVQVVLTRRLPHYDKSGEAHYNLISALHKSVRGSDPDAAMYWLARMLEGGEDPLYLARRMVRMASEDIGLADPRALSIALAGKEAYAFLGSPEGELALAQVAVYLATAPKSNRVYTAFGAARKAAQESPAAHVPLHLRNAPTGLMKELGYGVGYRYDHGETTGHAAGQGYLPGVVQGGPWYVPGDLGYEERIARRLRQWRSFGAATAEPVTDNTAGDRG